MAYAIDTVTAWLFFDDVIVYIESDPCVHTARPNGHGVLFLDITYDLILHKKFV